MHGSGQAVAGFCEALRGARLGAELDVLVFPPVAYLGQFADGVRGVGVAVGAQDLHPAAQGAHTGGISGAMIAELGGRWALVGHSERRSEHGESDALVAAKFAAALGAGLKPILCVGETLAQRQAGRAEGVVAQQVQAVIEAVGVEGLTRGAVAYEPVWAIGTGETAAPDEAAAMHALIRKTIAASDAKRAESIRVIYGGSVNAHNAPALFSEPEIDGGLIGGASLQAESFLAIVAAAGVNSPGAKDRIGAAIVDMTTFETILMMLLVLVALALGGLVLLQQGRGADAGAAFGSGASNTMFGSSGSASFLVKATAWLAVSFFVISFGLAWFAKERAAGMQDVGVPVVADPVESSEPSTADEGDLDSTIPDV